jgi:hypothetical protein
MAPRALEGWDWVGGVTRDGADDKRVLLTVRQDVGDSAKDGLQWKLYRYFALPARLDGGKLSWEQPISVPGRLVSSLLDKQKRKVLLTREHGYTLRSDKDTEYCWSASCHYEQSPRLHLLTLDANRARLRDTHDFVDWQLSGSMIAGQTLALMAYPPYRYYEDWSKRDDKRRLLLFDLSNHSFAGGLAMEFETSSISLVTARDNRLLLALAGDGLLTLDISDIKAPRGIRFTRTLGWLYNVAFSQDLAWVASGNFGTQVVPLDYVPTGSQL